MEYVGIACATDLRRTSLPAQLASLPLQLPIMPFTLVGMYSNVSLDARPSTSQLELHYGCPASHKTPFLNHWSSLS